MDLDAFSQSIYTGCLEFFSGLTPFPSDYPQEKQLVRWWAPPQGLWKTGQLPGYDEVNNTNTDDYEAQTNLFIASILKSPIIF